MAVVNVAESIDIHLRWGGVQHVQIGHLLLKAATVGLGLPSRPEGADEEDAVADARPDLLGDGTIAKQRREHHDPGSDRLLRGPRDHGLQGGQHALDSSADAGRQLCAKGVQLRGQSSQGQRHKGWCRQCKGSRRCFRGGRHGHWGLPRGDAGN